MAIQDPLTVKQTMAVRRSYVRTILDINSATNKLEKLHIETEELTDLHIHQMPLYLDERSHGRSAFFTTYQAELPAEETEDWRSLSRRPTLTCTTMPVRRSSSGTSETAFPTGTV